MGNCDPYSDSPKPLVVKQPKSTRVEEPTLLCNQMGTGTSLAQRTGPLFSESNWKLKSKGSHIVQFGEPIFLFSFTALHMLLKNVARARFFALGCSIEFRSENVISPNFVTDIR